MHYNCKVILSYIRWHWMAWLIPLHSRKGPWHSCVLPPHCFKALLKCFKALLSVSKRSDHCSKAWVSEVFLFICCSIPVFLFIFISFLFSVDMWSVGCIMGEMIKGAVLFPGTDRILLRSQGVSMGNVFNQFH